MLRLNEYLTLLIVYGPEEFCLCIVQFTITGAFGVAAAGRKRCQVRHLHKSNLHVQGGSI